MNDCLFCRIIKGEIPSAKFYEDDDILIIADINPQAAKHYLMMPKKHYSDIADMAEKEPEALGRMFGTLAGLIDKLGLSGGFRVVSNKGNDGCQSVGHLHIHILGGEKLNEKMG